VPNHVHLLINEQFDIPLDQFIKAVKQETSRRLKGDRKHFWQERYNDANIHTDEDDSSSENDALHPSQRGETRLRSLARAVSMEQLPALHHRRTRHPPDRIRVARRPTPPPAIPIITPNKNPMNGEHHLRAPFIAPLPHAMSGR
jgi:hypothetical protein